MASGKSTVAPLLARRLGWAVVDMDTLILERTGRTPGALIRDRGEQAFRAIERTLTEELADRRNAVLAPGGGWGARPELAALLGPGTLRVWLRVSAEEAVRRAAADESDRPLLGPARERLERASALLAEREAGYAAAEMSVDAGGRDPAAVADEIVRRLQRGDGEDDERA